MFSYLVELEFVGNFNTLARTIAAPNSLPNSADGEKSVTESSCSFVLKRPMENWQIAKILMAQ